MSRIPSHPPSVSMQSGSCAHSFILVATTAASSLHCCITVHTGSQTTVCLPAKSETRMQAPGGAATGHPMPQVHRAEGTTCPAAAARCPGTAPAPSRTPRRSASAACRRARTGTGGPRTGLPPGTACRGAARRRQLSVGATLALERATRAAAQHTPPAFLMPRLPMCGRAAVAGLRLHGPSCPPLPGPLPTTLLTPPGMGCCPAPFAVSRGIARCGPGSAKPKWAGCGHCAHVFGVGGEGVGVGVGGGRVWGVGCVGGKERCGVQAGPPPADGFVSFLSGEAYRRYWSTVSAAHHEAAYTYALLRGSGMRSSTCTGARGGWGVKGRTHPGRLTQPGRLSQQGQRTPAACHLPLHKWPLDGRRLWRQPSSFMPYVAHFQAFNLQKRGSLRRAAGTLPNAAGRSAEAHHAALHRFCPPAPVGLSSAAGAESLIHR
jgi:hypothetical protein